MIALHKEFCDSPADVLCRPSSKDSGVLTTSAVFPFPNSGCLALLKGTDVYRASIKRFNLCHSNTKKTGCQHIFHFFQKIVSLPVAQEKLTIYHWYVILNLYFSMGEFL